MPERKARLQGDRARAVLTVIVALAGIGAAFMLGSCVGLNRSNPPQSSGPVTPAAGVRGASPTPPTDARAAASGAAAQPSASASAATESATPTAVPGPRLLVPNPTPAGGQPGTGTWAQVNTPTSCLPVRLSFQPDSLAIDCLPYKLLVFIDGTQTVGGQIAVHLQGRGYVNAGGLTAVENPAENKLSYDDRPHGMGTVAYTANDGNVWTIQGDGANPAQITGKGPNRNTGAFYSSLAWSPDGSTLLLRRDTDTGRDVQVYQADKGIRSIYPQRATAAPVNPGVAAWSNDPQHVIVTDYDQPGDACERPANAYAIRNVDVSTGAVVELYHGQGNNYIAALSASPDGRSLAVLLGTACDAKSLQLCLLALQADPAYNVQVGQFRCPKDATAGEVAWSPDARVLAFTYRLQGRGDESSLSTGQPLRLMDPRSATFYPVAWPLRADRNIIGAVWLSDSRTLRIEEETPRGLTDTTLPDRIIRRVTVDGSRFPITEMAGDRLVAVRPPLTPGTVVGDYALATGARGEIWVVALGQQDQRWQVTDAAAGAMAWAP